MGQDDDVAILLASSAGRFLSEYHSPARARARRSARDAGDAQFWAAMAEQGWLGLRLPEADGGAGLSFEACIGLLHAFGRAAVPDGLIDGALMPGALLAGLAGSPAMFALGAALAEGSVRLAFAWQATLGQTVPYAAVRATPSDGGVRLGGAAIQVSLPFDALLVLADLNETPMIAHVPDAGTLACAQTRASDGSATGTITLHDTPGTVLDSGPGVLAACAAALAEAAMASAAVLGGIAERALELTVAYTQQRRQFDAMLASQQVVQHRLVDLRIQVALAAASLRKAARTHAAAPDSAEAALAVGAAKARASDTALTVTRGAVQLHGAIGYTEEAEIGIYLRAAARHAAAYGNAPTHRARVLALWPQEKAA